MRVHALLLKAGFIASLLITVVATPASASTIPIGIGTFGAGSTLTTFAGLADGTEVNGLTVDGIGFGYTLGSGQVILDGGPGVTNNISPVNIVSVGNPTGELTMALPGYAGSLGFGFALLMTTPWPTVVTIRLFDDATFVGGFVYGGSPDPTFTGGFAGIQSTIPFNKVRVVFTAPAAPAFALDNIRTAAPDAAAVPEPSTWLLFGTGLAAAAARRRFPKRA